MHHQLNAFYPSLAEAEYKIRVGWPGPCTPRIQVGPQRVTHRCALVIHRVLTGSISRVNLNAGTDISRTEGTRVRVGAPQPKPKHCNSLLNDSF